MSTWRKLQATVRYHQSTFPAVLPRPNLPLLATYPEARSGRRGIKQGAEAAPREQSAHAFPHQKAQRAKSTGLCCTPCHTKTPHSNLIRSVPGPDLDAECVLQGLEASLLRQETWSRAKSCRIQYFFPTTCSLRNRCTRGVLQVWRQSSSSGWCRASPESSGALAETQH